MRVYIGFDDTDTRESAIGTGKLARLFEAEMPAPEEMVLTNRWVRPKEEGLWENIDAKRVKQTISVGGSAG